MWVRSSLSTLGYKNRVSAALPGFKRNINYPETLNRILWHDVLVEHCEDTQRPFIIETKTVTLSDRKLHNPFECKSNFQNSQLIFSLIKHKNLFKTSLHFKSTLVPQMP